MNENEEKRTLFDAVTGIEEDLIAEAAEPRVRPLPKRLLRVAAIAAVLALLLTVLSFWSVGEENYVIGPGLLVVRAYATDKPELDDVSSIVLKQGIALPSEYVWRTDLSHRGYGMPLTLSISEDAYPGMEISFEILASDGCFRHFHFGFDDRLPNISLGGNGQIDEKTFYEVNKKGFLGNHFIVEYTIYWHFANAVQDIENERFILSDRRQPFAYADIIIWADENIVGYATVKFLDINEENGMSRLYSASVLEAVSFPKVDGKFQDVSRQYVEEQFDRIHNY